MSPRRLVLALGSAAILAAVVVVPFAGAAGPDVSITSTPTNPTTSAAAAFGFSSTDSTATFECSLDGAGFSGCVSGIAYSGLGDGGHTFQVRATNTVDGAGTAAAFSWTVDTTGPPTPSISGPTGTIADTTPSFTFSSSGAASFLCAMDDATPTTACSSPFTASALGDGGHTFYALARDGLGNSSAVGSSSFTVDTTPPPAPSISGPTGTIADSTPSFTFSSAGATSFACAIDDATPTAACSSPFTASALADGPHTFYALARDGAGNTSGVANGGSFTVDTAPPPTPTVTGPTGTITDKTPTFTFTSSGAASFVCAIDDTTPTTVCVSPFTPAALADGAHTFSVRARDTLLNASAAATTSFTVDTTPPPVPTLGGPTGTIADKTPSFTFTSTGATSFLCAIDDTTPTTACTSPFTPAALADGAHTFSAIARDALLNASAAATTSFTVDTTPPPVPTLGGPTGTIADKTPSFTFTSTGATSFLCAIDDATPTTVCTSPFTPAALADGAHTFYAIARDALLNASAAAGRTVTVDTTPPVLTGPGNLTVQANGPAGSQVNFTVSGSDAGAALLPSAITCTPASGSTFKVQNTTVTCTATDGAGNIGTVAFNIRVADSTPPSINAPDVSVTATSAAGIRRTDPALAAYLSAISATDLISSVKLTTNVPDTLPIGVTTIIVTAVDTSGNTAQKSVKITVLPPGTVAPPADFTPPGPVKNAAAKAGDRSIVLTWEPPAVPDLAYVEVRRSIVGQSGKGTLVYKGLKRTLTNLGLRNDVAYRYVLVAYDKVGNSSRSVVVTATPKTQLLAAPKPDARVTTPPLLQWAPVATASYFNVQLYRGSLKVLSAWPQVTRLQLGKRWVYEKKKFTLAPGRYTWYVWPGLGARSATRYGPLLGKSTFVVMKAKPAKKAKPGKKSSL